MSLEIPLVGAKYKHYKGTIYTVVLISCDAETGQMRVNYTNGDGKVWSHTVNNFLRPITYGLDRFTLI